MVYLVSTKKKPCDNQIDMPGSKWADLNRDCLISIFEKAGFESLILDLPLVCKSWYQASLHPHCWKVLDKPLVHYFKQKLLQRYGVKKLSSHRFTTFVIRRSGGNATTLVLQWQWTLEDLKFIADMCPALQLLSVRVSELQSNGNRDLGKCIWKFKHLKCLELQGGYQDYCIFEILRQISHHCTKFTAFSMRGIVEIDSASAIVKFIPQIKHLNLSASVLDRKALLHILEGCRELEVLDISYCEGVEMDKEILEMASFIKIFLFHHCREDIALRL